MVDEDSRRRERVKARWSMLRQALLKGSSAVTNEHSMHSFPGFQVLDRTIIPSNKDENNGNSGVAGDEQWDMVQYSYTSSKGHNAKFNTREAKEQTQQNDKQNSTIQSRMEALLSHRNHGVDNTGNVRVWDAEGTLAGFLLSLILDGVDDMYSEIAQSTELSTVREHLRSILMHSTSPSDINGQSTSPCNLLELGAGQAGLAGLGIAAATKKVEKMKPLHVILTDGHPKCVENNIACAKMMPECGDTVKRANIDAQLLLWDSSYKGAEACCQINKLGQNHKEEANSDNDAIADKGSYQLCLASDCVHFQEFHDGLLNTIARTLSVGGIALLCQPKRGTSLQNFMTMVDTVNASTGAPSSGGEEEGPLFQITLFEDFYPKVTAMHKELSESKSTAADEDTPSASSQQSSLYDPNWHRPLLLVLKKLRQYKEEVHGEAARQHVKLRGEA